jgi:hypothetical protein
MKPLKLIFLVGMLMLAVSGCRTTEPVIVPPDYKQNYIATYDDVWSAVTTVLKENGYTFKILDKSSGILQTNDVETVSGYQSTLITRTDYPANEIPSRTTYNIKIFIYPTDSAYTRVRLTLYAPLAENDAFGQDISSPTTPAVQSYPFAKGISSMRGNQKTYESSGYLELQLLSKFKDFLKKK